LNAIKAPHAVKRITFDKSEASPGETLYVRVPKLIQNEVLVPGSLALRFDIDLSGGHAVQNVARALVSKMVVKFAGTILQDTADYDLFKIYEDLFLSKEQRDKMYREGIQSEDLCKIRSNAGDKKTTGVDAENKLTKIYGTKYHIRLDHEILTDHSVFYPQALYDDLVFELKLSGAAQMVKGTDPTKLKYKLTNIQLEYEMIRRQNLAEEANSVYSSGKEFTYTHVHREKVIPIKKGSDARINIKVNAQRRSLKAILLLFTEPYTAGGRDSEKDVFPDLKKVQVTINGAPNMLYNEGIVAEDLWEEASRFFVREENKTEHMTPKLFLTGDKFGLVIDLRSMADRSMHGSGVRLVNSTDGVQLELERKASRSGTINCQVFVISDAQFDILGNQLERVQL